MHVTINVKCYKQMLQWINGFKGTQNYSAYSDVTLMLCGTTMWHHWYRINTSNYGSHPL